MARRGYSSEFRRRVLDLVEGGRKVADPETDYDCVFPFQRALRRIIREIYRRAERDSMDPRDQGETIRILDTAAEGDEQAAARLLPLVYKDRRGPVPARVAQIGRRQTLQSLELVHEASQQKMGDGERDFTGLSLEEPTVILENSSPTITRRWKYAHAWLRRELAPDQPLAD